MWACSSGCHASVSILVGFSSKNEMHTNQSESWQFFSCSICLNYDGACWNSLARRDAIMVVACPRSVHPHSQASKTSTVDTETLHLRNSCIFCFSLSTSMQTLNHCRWPPHSLSHYWEAYACWIPPCHSYHPAFLSHFSCCCRYFVSFLPSSSPTCVLPTKCVEFLLVTSQWNHKRMLIAC